VINCAAKMQQGCEVSSPCSTTISADHGPAIFILGTRDVAAPLRKKVETALETGARSICVDFSGLLVSQSFMDEFLGVLMLRYGPSILDQIVFKNCSDDVKAAIALIAKLRGQGSHC
jgi:hypothetical protein